MRSIASLAGARGRGATTMDRQRWTRLRRLSPHRTILAGRPTQIFVGRRFSISGRKNIELRSGARLHLGTSYHGFVARNVWSHLRVRGRLIVEGTAWVGRGSRLDVGPGATLSLGPAVSVSPDVLIVSTTSVTIGEGSAIGWGSQILDSDFHALSIEGVERESQKAIIVGERVWIGSRVTILKGAQIADGSVVASGTIVSGSFQETNVLIAGSPARIVRRNVTWA